MANLKLNSVKYSLLSKSTCANSSLPQKYQIIRRKLHMILRPRSVILTKLKSYHGLCSLQSPFKSSRRKLKKFQNKNVELKKTRKDASLETPYQIYRKQLMQTPQTPDNPFTATPCSKLRRSRRITGLRSSIDHNLAIGFNFVTFSAGRKRKLNEKKNAKLSPFSSGIQAFVANSNELAKAIKHNENVEAACKKSRVMSNDTATKSTGWNYSPMLDCTNTVKKSSVGHDQLRRQTIRRRLSARLNKLSQKELRSMGNTENMLGLPQLRGKYNHALFFDG